MITRVALFLTVALTMNAVAHAGNPTPHSARGAFRKQVLGLRVDRWSGINPFRNRSLEGPGVRSALKDIRRFLDSQPMNYPFVEFKSVEAHITRKGKIYVGGLQDADPAALAKKGLELQQEILRYGKAVQEGTIVKGKSTDVSAKFVLPAQ